MKTFLIFDSNALRVSDKNMKYGHFAIHNRLMELINKIEKNDLSENYQILIPQIVIEELKKQQVENFEESYKELKNLYEKMETLYFIDLNEPLQINYSEKIEELVTEFVNVNSIETLKICNENKFSNIVNRALNKKAPFRGTKGNSDKGFKDALIWESLIEFSQKHVGQYIYITKDRDFLLRQKELVREFLELTHKNIIFMEAEDLEKTPNIIDEAVNNKEELYRIQCVKEEFLSIKESFFEDLKAISFQSVVVSGNEFTEINLKFSDDYFFYEVNESLFQLTIPAKVILDDAGIHYELDVTLKFELSFNKEIKDIHLVETTAKLLNGKTIEAFEIEDFSMTFSEESDVPSLEPSIDAPTKISETQKRDSEDYVSGILKPEKINFVILKLDEKVLTKAEEIIDVVERSASLDWYIFPNKESLIKTDLKKLFRRNHENKDIINKLTIDLIDYAKKAYQEYDLIK